jgi:hypothetical protein
MPRELRWPEAISSFGWPLVMDIGSHCLPKHKLYHREHVFCWSRLLVAERICVAECPYQDHLGGQIQANVGHVDQPLNQIMQFNVPEICRSVSFGRAKLGITLNLTASRYFILVIYHLYLLLSIKHSWSNGRIIAFQAIGPGSTPGGCTTSF